MPGDIDRDAFAFAYRMVTPVWLFDIDSSRIRFANESACRMWQAASEAELGIRDLSVGMSSTVRKRLKQYQTDFEDGATFNEIWTIYPNGTPVSAKVNFSGFRLSNDRFALLCEASTPSASTPENLRSTEALLHTDVMISLFRRDGPPLYMNPAARNAAMNADLGFADLFVDTQDHDLMMFELDRKGEHRLVAKVYTEQGLRWHNLSAKSCADSATGEPAILVTANDVSELKNARDRARYLAHRDQLTGCFNRSHLQKCVSELSRYHAGTCALLFFDIDRFKMINDRYGHETGDQILKKLATRAQAGLAKSDTLVRLGGDEFVILYRDVEDREVLVGKVEHLLEQMSEPFQANSIRLTPTVSMGLAFFEPGADSLTNAMSEADIALYASKVGGRNRLTVFNETLGAAAKERDQIEVDLKAAIERDEFVLHYQPRIDINSQRILAVEALVRWQHPTRGLLSPGVFIPICEETGLIEQIGQIILKRGLNQAQAWFEQGIDIGVSINISPLQLEDPNLIATLENFARRPGFAAQRIELEVTENVLIGDLAKMAQRLRDIAALGYRIAIDDFGVGYSNLSYISDFPVDCIKIDRSFIGKLPEAGPVIRLILALARQIGACTVAEGVETAEQANWLLAQACDQAQGFLFHPPMPVDDLMAAVSTD